MKEDTRTGPGPEYNPWYDQWILDSNTRKFMALLEYPRLATNKIHSLKTLKEHREGKEEVAANARLIATSPALLQCALCPMVDIAHDILSDVLETPGASADAIRQAALAMCYALNENHVKRNAAVLAVIGEELP